MSLDGTASATCPRIMVAGVSSGVGKTTIASAIMAALARRGLRVQPFKAGPDYIDPSYHTLAAGRPSRNLDSWLVPHAHLQALFQRAMGTADVGIIEGVMGLFDGRGPLEDEGSSAELAKLLQTPVLLVIDANRLSRSAAAMVLGYLRLDPELRLAGVIANQVGSPGHYRWVKQAVEHFTGVPVLGYLEANPALQLTERHLGLIPASEQAALADTLERASRTAEESIDLGAVLDLARAAPALEVAKSALFPPAPVSPRATIAVAMDEAFSFYYRDNLELLEAYGARLAPFSPLRDEDLPAGVSGVYLGGGFPELFAGPLAANQSLLQQLRRLSQEGLPIYAECGGLMYLAERLSDEGGAVHTLAGLLPCDVSLAERRVVLRYMSVRAKRGHLFLPEGSIIRGHEFHLSRLSRIAPSARRAYEIVEPGAGLEGFSSGRVLASYVHLHFGTEPGMAARFVAACASRGEG